MGCFIQEQDVVVPGRDQGFISKALSPEGRLNHCSYTLLGQLQVFFLQLTTLIWLGSCQARLVYPSICKILLHFNTYQEEHLVGMAQTLRPLSYLKLATTKGHIEISFVRAFSWEG